jgi:hypothetical protein
MIFSIRVVPHAGFFFGKRRFLAEENSRTRLKPTRRATPYRRLILADEIMREKTARSENAGDVIIT